MIGLQPPQHALFPLKHSLCLVAQARHDFVTRLAEPRNLLRDAIVLFLICPLAAPIVNLDTAFLPIAYLVPLDRLVRRQDLARAETRVAPEFRDLVKAGKDARGNALSLQVSRSQQQKPSRGLRVPDQRSPARFCTWELAPACG